MNKTVKSILIGFVATTSIIASIALINRLSSKAEIKDPIVKNDSDYVSVKRLSNRVFETNYYRNYDEEFAIHYLENKYDDWFTGGGCTAMAKQVSNGDVVVARNMDLYITDKPSFVVRTKIPGRKETIGLTYNAFSGESADKVRNHGVLKDVYNMLPAMQTDVMNSEGFYIEINMRNATYKNRLIRQGEEPSIYSVFSCSGTNPGKKRIMASMLPEYLGTRCSTISEALNIARNDLDIYTPSQNNSLDWNFAFMMADSSGRYGVMEIAKNQIVFSEGKAAEDNQDEEATLGAIQANYYLDEDFSSEEEMGAGIGRVEYLQDLYSDIETEQEMMDAIKDVSYFQAYDRENCKFDSRSEFVGYHIPDSYFDELSVWTSDYVLDNDNLDEINDYIDWCKERIAYYQDLGKLEEVGLFWNSTFTLTANVTKRTINVRFFEDNNNYLELNFK